MIKMRRKTFIPENIYEDVMDKMGHKALLYMKLHGVDGYPLFGLCNLCKSLCNSGANNYCVRMSRDMERLQYDTMRKKVFWTKAMLPGLMCIDWVKYVK